MALVDLGEAVSVVQQHVKKQNISFNSFVDEGKETGSLYQLIGVPTLVFVGQDGMVKSMDHQLPDDINGVFKQ